MTELWLRLRAPFAAFRYFQAGVYRQSSPTIPYTAAWGLVLNLAGIETRTNQHEPITEIDPSAPRLNLAIGPIKFSERSSLYQQLHSYPVGNSGKDLAPLTKGAKYWIAPVRRELLVDFDVMVGVQCDDDTLLQTCKKGLRGELQSERYGLPFAGDNNLLFDSIDILDEPLPAYWYTQIDPMAKPRKGSCRLSTKIDRKNSSKSRSGLFAPIESPQAVPPDSAWVLVPSA